MIRTLRKWVSAILIAALCAGFIVIPERNAFAEDRPQVDLVAILVDSAMMNDASQVAIREDLRNEFAASMHNMTMSDRVRRYADDIQAKLPMSKVIIIPVNSSEEPWKIQEALAKLYTEGDGVVSTTTKLKGIVLIGNIPLPLVTKNGRSYVSLYPYTDFEDQLFTYNFDRQEFVTRETTGRAQPEIWHGVIPYPISWEQYVRDGQREQELSKIRREQGVDAYAARLDQLRQEYNSVQREELAHYLDKNHSFYTKGSYSLFSKKALIMDIFREFQSVTDFGLAGYQAYLDNWDNKSYMRYTREWLDALQNTYFAEATSQLALVYGTDPDGTATTPAEFLANAENEIRNNPKLSQAEKERQIRALQNSAQKGNALQSELQKNISSSDVIPDIFTRDPIENFLHTATEVFGAVASMESGYFQNTGRWSLTGQSGDREGFTLYKIVQMLDEQSRQDILEVNTALENELDTMLNEAAEKSLNMQLDIPSAPINYFGRYTSYLYKSPQDFINIGDIFNYGVNLKYVPGHYFYLDLVPTPPREGMTINMQYDALQFLAEVEKPENAQRYVAYTGQQYNQIVHHRQVQSQADTELARNCAQSSLYNEAGISNTDLEKECTMLYDNPSPAQLKYLELYDPKTGTIPAGKQLQIYQLDISKKLLSYLEETAKPEIGYMSQQIMQIGDSKLFFDFSWHTTSFPPKPLKDFSNRLKEHISWLERETQEFTQFRVIVHVVDLPFSAQQCTIYLGGSPEVSKVGDDSYPLYLRGATETSPQAAARKEANSWESASGNLTGLENTSNWRQEKVQTQVTLALASQQKNIRNQEMNIDVRSESCRRIEDSDAAKACWEDVSRMKQERDRSIRLMEQAGAYYTKIWNSYYGTMEGDKARFGAYLDHVGTLASQVDLSKTIEANRLYDQGQDASMRMDKAATGSDADENQQRMDAAASLDPVWFGYKDLRLDKRPASFQFPDWFDYLRNGYWGGCAAPNLRRVEDSATTVALSAPRQEMEGIFQELRDGQIERIKRKSNADFIKFVGQFLFPPMAVYAAYFDMFDAQGYYVDVLSKSEEIFQVMESMIDNESFEPSVTSPDSIEAAVAAYKNLLKMEKETILRDITEQEYNAMKPELRAITRNGVRKLADIERAFIEVSAKKPEERQNNAVPRTINPRDFGIEAPEQKFLIYDTTTRDNAKSMLYDLVQGQYELRLMQNNKITPITLQSLRNMGGRSIEGANAIIATIQGEIDEILYKTSISELLRFVGVTCDPQRAMEPIFDVAGGKALTDPGYIPLRTTDRTVNITDANTLTHTVLQGNEFWGSPGKDPRNDELQNTRTYTPPGLNTMLDAAPTWKDPVLKEYHVERSPGIEQTYRDDYPKTRSDILYDAAQIANSYEQGWEYTRKGYLVTEDQPASLSNPKPLNEYNGTPLPPETSYLACLRYAQFGMEPNEMKTGNPPDTEKVQSPNYGNNYSGSNDGVYPIIKDSINTLSRLETYTSFSGWTTLNQLFQAGAGGVSFAIAGHDGTMEEKNALLQFLKEFERRANSDAANWRPFPNSRDQLSIEKWLPLEFTGKWGYEFQYIMQLPNKLEQFYKENVKGPKIDTNDPEGRQELYSLYGVRRIATVIEHKEPTNETIARQLKSMSATSLPVNNPRYVDFYLYEPIPQLNKYGEVERWKEYEEHVSIPYVNLFRAFPDEKRFSYIMENDRKQYKDDMVAVQERIDSIMKGFDNYLSDYIAKTSMSGPRATIAAAALTTDTSSIGDEEVRGRMNRLVSGVVSQLGQAKNPQELQTVLQQNLGGTWNSDVLDPTNLEGVQFDTQRFNTVLAQTSLGDGQSDRTLAAKKKLAFSVYWQHMTLAEKYKYVMHNYLTSKPDPDTIDMNFWQQATDYTASDGAPQTKVGFEAATIILESPVASRMQIPLEQIQGVKQTQGSIGINAIPTKQVSLPAEEGPCDQTYGSLGGSKYGVPLENWGSAIQCWVTTLWPLTETVEENELNFKRWSEQATREGENFARDTGRFVDAVVDTGEVLASGARAVWDGAGAALDGAGKWLNDMDQDGLSAFYAPVDSNPYNADDINAAGESGKPNGFKDGQDKVYSLRMYASNEKIQVSESSKTVVSIPQQESVGVIPYGSGNPLEIKVALMTAANEVLTANSIDMVRLDIVSGNENNIITLPDVERLQRASEGVATFRVFASNASESFGTVKVKATVVRQQLPNSSYQPNATDISAEFEIKVTPEVLAGVLHRIPCTPEERDSGRCARGDVRSSQADSIYSTNETAHLLSIVATDKSKTDSIVERSGSAVLRYYKGAMEPENLYKKAMGDRDNLTIQLQGGTYQAAYAVPKESGKYFIEVTPEGSLGMAPLVLSFLVVDTTYTTMRLLMNPSIAIEGQDIILQPSFTNFAGEEVDLGVAQASVGIPLKTPVPLDMTAATVFDGMPGGDTEDYRSIDIAAGKVKELVLPIPDTAGSRKEPYTLDLLLSKISPLSQIAAQAGTVDAAVAQGLAVKIPLQVYPKGSLDVRATLVDGSTTVTVPVLLDSETTCVNNPTASAGRAFTVNIEIRDKNGRSVPYTGDLVVTPQDFGLFKQLPSTVSIANGRGTLTVTPSRKAGKTTLAFQDEGAAFTAASITVTTTPGPLAALRFTTQVTRPLEAASEQGTTPNPDTMLPLRYVGLDICGNPVNDSDNTTIALDIQPPLGDGRSLELLALDTSAAGQVGRTDVTQDSSIVNMATQRLAEGRNTVALRALNFRGEASLTVRALTTDGSGKTVINQRITPDSVSVPIRLTLRKELLESLEPNILYTNLLGGPYGDVTQKDFLGAWWMLTGKTQVVTTSTVGNEIPANLAKVLPNGAIDMGKRTSGGLGMEMFVEPKLEANMPFTVEVKDTADGAVVMQVRYNIVPFISGAIFENYATELTPDMTAALAPGMYIVPATGVSTRKDLLQQNRSVVRFFGPDGSGVQREAAILADNMQFFPGNGAVEQPVVAMNTTRLDIMTLALQDSDNRPLATIYVKLDPQRVFPTDGDYTRDVQLSLDTVRAGAVSAGDVTTQNGAVQLSDDVTSRLTEASAKVPGLAGVTNGIQYVRQEIARLENLDGIRNGIFTRAVTDRLLRIVATGENAGLYVGEKLFFPFRNLAQNLPAIQAWLGANTLRYQLELANDAMRVHARYASTDNASLDMLTLYPVYGAANLDWDRINTGASANETGWYLTQNRSGPYTYATENGLQLLAPRRDNVPGAPLAGVQCAPIASTENLPAAGILPTGETYTCFDSLLWERTLVTRNNKVELHYTLKENGTSGTRLVTEAYLHFDDDRSFRILSAKRGEADLFSTHHQAVYVTLEDDSHVWNAEQGQIIRKNALPGGSSGLVPVLSLTPAEFLQIPAVIASSGLYRTRLDTTQGIPTVVIDESREGTWTAIATMRLQMQENAPRFKAVATANIETERASTDTDIVRIYLANTNLQVREEGTQIRVIQGSQEIVRLQTSPLAIQALGSGVVPELLDISPDRFQVKLGANGSELLTLEVRYNPVYTRLISLKNADIPEAFMTVPGVYVRERTPLLRMQHSSDRSFSRLMFGYEEVMTIGATGGQRILRPDLVSMAYRPAQTSGQFIAFTAQLFGVDGMSVFYTMASLPFDLRILTYIQEQNRPALETEMVTQSAAILRPRDIKTATGFLALVGRFLDLARVQESITERNSQFTNTTVSLPVRATGEGYLAANLQFTQRNPNQTRDAARLIYVPLAAAPGVQDILRSQASAVAVNGLAILRDADAPDASCVRADTRTVNGAATQLLTCRDPRGVRFFRRDGTTTTPVASIRNDGSYIVHESAYDMRLRLDAGSLTCIFYTLTEKNSGAVVLEDVVMGGSTTISAHVRRGTPEADQSAPAGTYVSYVATPSSADAVYSLMQEVPGVANSANTLLYCTNKNDLARTCQPQLSLSAATFLQRANDQFTWVHETGIKDVQGYTFPAFGYQFQSATRVATLALLLNDTPLTAVTSSRGNVSLTAQAGAEVMSQDGTLQLRQGSQTLLALDLATGRVQTNLELRALAFTPADVRFALFNGTTQLGELRITRSYVLDNVIPAEDDPVAPRVAGMYVSKTQNMLQVLHDFPEQSTRVQLGYDRLFSLMPDGRVDVAIPSMVRTLLPEGEQQLRLQVNRETSTLDIGTGVLVAFPLETVSEKLQTLAQQLGSSVFQTIPGMKTTVDAFGNLITDAYIQKKGTSEQRLAAQLRPVFAPSKPQIIYTATPQVPTNTTLPAFQLNPTAFFNAIRSEAYTVTEKNGNLYFHAPSANPYWTSSFGRDAACIDTSGPALVAVLLHDGTRVLCDPLHTMDLGFDTTSKLFSLTLRTLQRQQDVSSVIGTVYVTPGDTARYRLLTGENTFHADDVANGFSLQGIYAGVQSDYTFGADTMELRLTKGDRAPVWSAATKDFMGILTSGRVWNNSADRFYISFENATDNDIALTQRRMPLAWKVMERREVRYTQQGSEAWSGDLMAASMRLTLTDPEVRIESTVPQEGVPSFVCDPAKTEVTCTVEQDGSVRLDEVKENATVATEANLSAIPAVLFRKDSPARWLDTGLWNGTTRFDAGEKTGVARLELFGTDGQVRAVMQYRPALQVGRPRVSVYTSGTAAPVLSASQPEVQILLANARSHVLEKTDFFAIVIDESVQTEENLLLALSSSGSVNAIVRRLQNLDALSFDGSTARLTGTVGQFGLSIEATRDRLRWVIGDIAALLPPQTSWKNRTYAEVQEQPQYSLAKGETVVEALKPTVSLTTTEDAVTVQYGPEGTAADTVATIPRNSTVGATNLAESIVAVTRSTQSAEELLLVDAQPAQALIHMVGNPRVAATANAVLQDPYTDVFLVPAGTTAPNIDRPGTGYVQAGSTDIRLMEEGPQILVDRRDGTNWQRVATVNKRTLAVTLVDTNRHIMWQRGSTSFIESFIQDVDAGALVRVRRQNLVPDLLRTSAFMADIPRANTAAVSIEQRDLNADRSLDSSSTAKAVLFGGRLQSAGGAGVRIQPADTGTLVPAQDITRQQRAATVMRVQPDRLLVSSLDTLRYHIVPHTLLPNLQRYTVYPAGSTQPADAIATITRSHPYAERYTPARWMPASGALNAISAPGMLVREVQSLVSMEVNTTANTTTVHYGFDDIGTLQANGTMTSIATGWQALMETARLLRSTLEGTVVELFGVPYIRYTTRRNPQGYTNNGQRNTIFVEARNKLGSTPVGLTLGADRPTQVTLGTTALTWNQQMVANILSPLLQYTHETAETSVLKFNITTAAGPLASLFIQTVADPSAGDGNTTPDNLGSLPVDQVTQALDILGGTGIYVQIRSPEKGLLSLAYEPSGDSTNNLYSVALRDASMPLLPGDQINPQTVGVEDALLGEAAGLGYKGDYKNMLLFAGGNTVGESTLPYMSEALINLGDPVISLTIEDNDRTNESFTDDIGVPIYTHTQGTIQQMVLYDVDQDGRKDIVFTDGDGVLEVIRNEGGTPVRWKYLGGSFEFPEGVKELLIMQLENKDNMAVVVGRPGQQPIRTTENAVTAVSGALDQSFVEIRNTAGQLERCQTAVPGLGTLQSAIFGDLDGNGTDDLVALTAKNEIKAVQIDPGVDCGITLENKSRYKVETVDTIGMRLDGAPISAPQNGVPQGYNILPQGDVYARFNGAYEQQWNPLQSVCPTVDPSKTTPVYPATQVPTSLPANPEMVFIPEPEAPQGAATSFGSDPISQAAADLRQNLPGSEGVYFSYQGNGEQLMRMMVAGELPYIRSGGQSLTRYNEAFNSIAQTNPFSCLASGYGGVGQAVGSFAGNIAGQVGQFLGFLSGPIKANQMEQEQGAAENAASTMYITKYGKDLNGGIIQQEDTIAYAISITNNLPGAPTKNIDIGDRFQQGTSLLPGSVTCQRGETRFACTDQPSNGLFGLYIPNLEIRGGQTVTIFYQAKVQQSPFPLTLQLWDTAMLASAMLDQKYSMLASLKPNLDPNLPGAAEIERAFNQQVATIMGLKNFDKQKIISVSTPAMAENGSFVYWQKNDNTYGADILRKAVQQHPIMKLPIIGKVLESLGLIWDEEGNIDPNATSSGSGNDVAKDATAQINNLLTNAFLASDRDLDGLVDLWDEDVTAPPMSVSDISAYSKTPTALDRFIGDVGRVQKSAGQAAAKTLNKVEKSLSAVNRELQSMDCNTGGCSLVPADWNTAFFAPGTDAMSKDAFDFFGNAKDIGGSVVKDALKTAADNTAYAVFAAPTPEPPLFFWPPSANYESVKAASQFRVYMSVTLTGRFALTACAGPYHVGMLYQPTPTGFELIKNCYSFLLPDILNIKEFCRDLADGLSGFVGGLGRVVTSGGYSLARVKKAGSITGMGAQEPPAAFVADQFVFETNRFKDPTSQNLAAPDVLGKAVGGFLKDFRQLGRGTAQVVAPNKRMPGFPAFVMDWIERQIHEVLAKLLTKPTITIIYPDPRIGFTMPVDANNDTLEKRIANDDMTSMDVLQQRVTDLSCGFLSEEQLRADPRCSYRIDKQGNATVGTQADQAKQKAAANEAKSLKETCEANNPQDRGICSDPARLNEQLAKLDAAASLNLGQLPENDYELSQAAAENSLQFVQNDMQKVSQIIATLPDSNTAKAGLQNELEALQQQWENPPDGNSVLTGMLTRSRKLLADAQMQATPGFATNQLRAYNQLKQTESERAALAECSTDDPVGCALQNADQSYRQFMDSVSLESGSSLSDGAALLNAGASSNDLIKREVRGFSEVMAIISSLPFVTVRMRDVVFYYPWLPPDRISETLYNLQGVQNQSLENFHNFYSRWAYCFYEPDANGNVNWNRMLPLDESFTVRDTLRGNTESNATGAAGASVTYQHCLAAARVAGDAYAGLQGIEANINQLKEYGNILNSMKQYIQWKTYIVGRVLRLVSGLVGQLVTYINDQNTILRNWRDTIRSIGYAIETFQVLVDVFDQFQKQCTTCQNQRGTTEAEFMDMIGNFIQLQVVAVPKIPDVEIDLSNINMRYEVVIPNIRFIPQQINLPRFNAITMPSLDVPQAQLNLIAQQGLNVSMPILPGLPNLPRLPELPAFRFPKLPDLPPPPQIPQLNMQVRQMVNIVGQILNIVCLLQRNILPIAESRVRSHLASMTTSPVVMRTGQVATTPTYEPTIDRIRLSTQVNITFDTNRTFSKDTYMWIFDQAAQTWNNFVRNDLVNPANLILRDIPQRAYGTAVNFVNTEVTGKAVGAINQTLNNGARSLNDALRENISIPVTDFQQNVRAAILKKQAEAAANRTTMNAEEERKAQMVSAANDDPFALYLIDQMLALETAVIQSAHTNGVADPNSFLPELERQIALLRSDDSGLPEHMRDKAVERLENIVTQAKRPASVVEAPLDVEKLPYVKGWRSLEQELAAEEQTLGIAERTLARLDTAKTIEEFKSVLDEAGMLAAESYADKPVASIGEQESVNQDSQRLLDTLAEQVGREVPMDTQDTGFTKQIIREEKTLAQAPEVGNTGAAVASNIGSDGAPLIAQNGVITGPAVTQSSSAEGIPEQPDHAVGISAEEEGALLVELPDNGGLITLMNYVPAEGLPVQLAMAPLSGNGERPDAIVSIGSDIYFKENIYNRLLKDRESAKTRYTGSDRVRVVGGIQELIPVLPAVQGIAVTNVSATEVQFRFDLPARTRQVNEQGAFIGPDARYVLRIYSRIMGTSQGETPVEYVILPVPAEAVTSNQARLNEILQQNTASMPTDVQQKLTEEAQRQGLAADRVLLGVMNGSTVQVRLPVDGRETPMFMTVIPRVTTENGTRTGLASPQFFAHPQRAQDTTPPVITIRGGNSQVVPLESAIELEAVAEDAINDVVSIAWDTDLLKDTDMDGDAGNDQDMVCGTGTPCTVPLATMNAQTRNRSAVPTLSFSFKKTWQAGDTGTHQVRAFAKDSLGNVGSTTVTLEVLPTEVHIDEYNAQTGVVRGRVYPPQANKKLQLLRMRNNNVSELHLPESVVTDGQGYFEIQGVTAGQGTAVYNGSGQVMEETTTQQ